MTLQRDQFLIVCIYSSKTESRRKYLKGVQLIKPKKTKNKKSKMTKDHDGSITSMFRHIL